VKSPNYKQFKKYVFQMCETFIQDFSQSEGNRNVYVFALDVQEDCGSVQICLNTEEGFDESVKNNYSDYSEKKLKGLSGVKYSPGDFSFLDFGEGLKEYDDWCINFEKYTDSLIDDDSKYVKALEKLSDVLVDVLDDLSESFKSLDQTKDFIAIHFFHDVIAETTEALIRKSVPSDLFDTVFPEIKEARELINNINSLDEYKKIEVWMTILENYRDREVGKYSKEYFKNKTYWDVRLELADIGIPVLDKVFELLDSVIYEEQFNEEGSEAWEQEGAFSKAEDVSFLLLNAISEINYVSEIYEKRLLGYLKKLYEVSAKVEGTIGTNLMGVANTLHDLLPEKFPKPKISSAENRLMNSKRRKNFEQVLKGVSLI